MQNEEQQTLHIGDVLKAEHVVYGEFVGKVLDTFPWSEYPYLVERTSSIGKHIEQFNLGEFITLEVQHEGA